MRIAVYFFLHFYVESPSLSREPHLLRSRLADRLLSLRWVALALASVLGGAAFFSCLWAMSPCVFSRRGCHGGGGEHHHQAVCCLNFHFLSFQYSLI